MLVQRMEAALQSSLSSALMEISGGKVTLRRHGLIRALMETAVVSHASLLQALDYNTVNTLLSDTKTLCQILDEAVSLLKMFWRAALPSSDGPAHLIQRVRTSTSFSQHLLSPKNQMQRKCGAVSTQEQSMREEIQQLRLRIAEQEEVLQGTIQRLRCSNRTKESMETFIVNQRESDVKQTVLQVFQCNR